MKCAITDTVQHIKLLAQNMMDWEPYYVILAILLDLGIPANHVGFRYLQTAVLIQYEHPDTDTATEIYRRIIAHYGYLSEKLIANAIRSSIRTAWFRGDLEKWCKYLPAACADPRKPPANAEVIAGLARILELWHGCTEAYLRQQNREVTGCGRK